MVTRDPRIDAYIERSAEFARPILRFLRQVVHAGCPDVTETIKWGMPHFEHRGILCHMAAFKHHCAFGFWRGAVIVDAKTRKPAEAMGQFGRITHRRDLPARKVLVGYVRQAARLNDSGAKGPEQSKRATPRKPPPVPAELRAALAKNRRARETFEGLSPSKRRDYIEWIAGASREATRASRLRTALEWLAEGKSFHWRYEKPRRAPSAGQPASPRASARRRASAN